MTTTHKDVDVEPEVIGLFLCAWKLDENLVINQRHFEEINKPFELKFKDDIITFDNQIRV